ncbi:glycosyltransferase family 2 protein [Domibacillus indicus]|uniref:glycosyltransferase family 2 protein n=1 Tax=Domibacillus indicus TaxID=1437523 RepID=UPI0006183350|nr:glycosyltransferase [Domibacillus indicus]
MSADISVVIPMYNCESYLRDCLKSVADQGMRNRIEVVMVDDGSADKSGDTAAKLLRELGLNGKVLFQENGGVSRARNHGLQYSTGQYVTFLDADDTFPEKVLFHLFEQAERTGAALCYGGFEQVDEKMEKTIVPFAYEYVSGTGADVMEAYLLSQTWVRLGAFIVKKKLVEENNILFAEGCKYGEDQEFTLKCLAVSPAVDFVPVSCYRYRQHSGSVMKKFTVSWFHYVDAMIRTADFCRQYAGADETLMKCFKRKIEEAYFTTIRALLSQNVSGKQIQETIHQNGYKAFVRLNSAKITAGRLFHFIFFHQFLHAGVGLYKLRNRLRTI